MAARQILISNGTVIVDSDNIALITRYRWHVLFRDGVAESVETTAGGRTLLLHRVIMGAKKGVLVDHINGDVCDNRRANLRICTPKQNAHNRRRQITSSNPYKGILWKPRNNVYEAYVFTDGTSHYLGSSKDAAVAGRMYDAAASILFGEYAFLNFPDDREETMKMVHTFGNAKFWREHGAAARGEA